MGSFRRGKESSGDVDVLITIKDCPDSVPRDALPRLVNHLTKQGHVAHNITLCTDEDCVESKEIDFPQQKRQNKSFRSCTSYMGVFFSPKYPGKKRRVDIKIYPYNQKSFASLCKFQICRHEALNRERDLTSVSQTKISREESGSTDQ